MRYLVDDKMNYPKSFTGKMSFNPKLRALLIDEIKKEFGLYTNVNMCKSILVFGYN